MKFLPLIVMSMFIAPAASAKATPQPELTLVVNEPKETIRLSPKSEGQIYRLQIERPGLPARVIILSGAQSEEVRAQTARLLWSARYQSSALGKPCVEVAKLTLGEEGAPICRADAEAVGLLRGLVGAIEGLAESTETKPRS